ncbi:hypothetical protein L7F22_046046 [Adiantum nelumboides]|nr:hypothetical protein [Adiantum nelumboides]
MEEIDFKSQFPAVPANSGGWKAVRGHGNDSSAETKAEAHDSLVEAQSKVIRISLMMESGIVDNVVWAIFGRFVLTGPFHLAMGQAWVVYSGLMHGISCLVAMEAWLIPMAVDGSMVAAS